MIGVFEGLMGLTLAGVRVIRELEQDKERVRFCVAPHLWDSYQYGFSNLKVARLILGT